MRGPKYTPLKQHELARALQIGGNQRSAFRHLLYQMAAEGKIVCRRKNRWAVTPNGACVTGRLRVHEQGYGFVTPAGAVSQEDVFIPADQMGTALDGDQVSVHITDLRSAAGRHRTPLRTGNSRRATGRIARVLERFHTMIVGTLQRTAYYWYVIPDAPGLPHNVRVRESPPSPCPLVPRHRVVVRLDAWESATHPLTGVVMEDLGAPGQPGVDITALVRHYCLKDRFSAAVLEGVSRVSPQPGPVDCAGRRDLRSWITLTIDPEDARDYDDAVSLSPTSDGGWLLGVHIADVAHYVPPHTPLDQEAFEKGTSVYLVDRVIPMLPPYLTTEVCSLQPGRDRLTRSVELHYDHAARLRRAESYLSVIRSSARLSYDQVQRMLDGHDGHGIPDEVQPVLRSMAALAARLRRQRLDAGGIDFNMPEVKCILGPDGRAQHFVQRMAGSANQLIEEFMLAANREVARHLADGTHPALYRVHDAPAEEQWARMAEELHTLGMSVAPPRDRDDLNAIAQACRGTPLEYQVQLTLLRNLQRAIYMAEAKEHFGLAWLPYTHFTSPIRRYPDLVVHRLLQAADSGRALYSREELADIAAHCSATEEAADLAAAESLELKRLDYYQHLLADDVRGPWEGLVVGLSPAGLLVELRDTLQRGRVSFRHLPDDHYVLNAERTAATGQRRRQTWKIGQLLSVNLERVDPVRRHVDLVPAWSADAPTGETKKPRRHATVRHTGQRNK